ncbi:DUF2330 domain-containing protein [uncultured Tateyamaria sp.]|uniref:DUF2330 domain-containing protein n=1 Tax=uncultured Tateyamaria sp. TaxID=455651 RepID=UPI0026336A59|nr:DUF2330 domain-containing protein [uncultured Tateyamaria sp.]
MFRQIVLAIALVLGCSLSAEAFCGFYVAKADGSLYNQSSKVVFVRDGRKSTITMSSDYRGAASDFAMIVPTPRVLRREQVDTVDADIVAHLDSYTAPRLVEYFDHDPCDGPIIEPGGVVAEFNSGLLTRRSAPSRRAGAAALGVRIAAEYAVGNYDILILKAKQSDGLSIFLKQEGYKLPDGAEAVLGDYIKAGMKFFVARVNLGRHSASQTKELPPLQISFRADKFMLPIQLGKLNADKAQDALFFMLAREGRVEVANYKAKALPTDENVPPLVENYFPQFYKAAFNRTVGSRGGIAMEYAWDMSWCDPCAADPLPNDDLRALGVSWIKGDNTAQQDVYVTRYHAQYTKNQMPKDVVFKVTDNRNNFQGRYVMNQPFDGEITCAEGQRYVRDKKARMRKEEARLRKLTGWSAGFVTKAVLQSVPRIYW